MKKCPISCGKGKQRYKGRCVSTNVHDMTASELKKGAKQLFETIFIVDCYSTSDQYNYETILNELDRRGYDISENINEDKPSLWIGRRI